MGDAAQRAAVDAGEWVDLGQLAEVPRPNSACYRAAEHTVVIAGRSCRAVVVHSDHLEARQGHTFAKRLAAQKQALNKDLAALARERFTCQADAEAAGAFLQRAERGPFPVRIEVSRVLRPLRSGRRGHPPKDQPVQRVRQFVITGTVGDHEPTTLAQEESLLGLFVLITNLEDRTACSARRPRLRSLDPLPEMRPSLCRARGRSAGVGTDAHLRSRPRRHKGSPRPSDLNRYWMNAHHGVILHKRLSRTFGVHRDDDLAPPRNVRQ